MLPYLYFKILRHKKSICCNGIKQAVIVFQPHVLFGSAMHPDDTSHMAYHVGLFELDWMASPYVTCSLKIILLINLNTFFINIVYPEWKFTLV